jgi:hypothetical protein
MILKQQARTFIEMKNVWFFFKEMCFDLTTIHILFVTGKTVNTSMYGLKSEYAQKFSSYNKEWSDKVG